MSRTQYQFDNPEDSGRRMRCPKCGEMLYPVDVDSVFRCPYCETQLEVTPELEDFILDPLARQWKNRFSRE